MSIGLYIHIPFCLQQCPYCDFTTRIDDTSLHQSYVENLRKEIRTRAAWVNQKDVSTVYFGGGTPSLLKPDQLASIIDEFRKNHFKFDQLQEFSIEINPGTISDSVIQDYIKMGINRFSVGAQSFNDEILKKIGRDHTSCDTIASIQLLKSYELNYSFDLLFSLPGQSLEMLNGDLDKIEQFRPPHISSYYLTIPQRHKLNKDRPVEETDLKMFDLVESRLAKMNYHQYEISNFALAGYRSVHNFNAWKGYQYWGVGISAHSHLKVDDSSFRFWNPNTISSWAKQLESISSLSDYPNLQIERLSKLDQLNDFVHTRLRTSDGFGIEEIPKLNDNSLELLSEKIDFLLHSNHLAKLEGKLQLTKLGRRTLNFVLEKLFISSN